MPFFILAYPFCVGLVYLIARLPSKIIRRAMRPIKRGLVFNYIIGTINQSYLVIIVCIVIKYKEYSTEDMLMHGKMVSQVLFYIVSVIALIWPFLIVFLILFFRKSIMNRDGNSVKMRVLHEQFKLNVENRYYPIIQFITWSYFREAYIGMCVVLLYNHSEFNIIGFNLSSLVLACISATVKPFKDP